MLQPSEFGIFLKSKRKEAQLLQDELAKAIGKTGQYISNIEKGKNNSPPKESDIEALIQKLELSPEDAQEFRLKAAADRQQLPKSQMQYITSHPSLLRLLCYAEQNNIEDNTWETLFSKLSTEATNNPDYI